MAYSFSSFVKGEDQGFFIGDKVHIKTTDSGGRSGVISRITTKSVYLNVGNKRDCPFSFEKISEIHLLE